MVVFQELHAFKREPIGTVIFAGAQAAFFASSLPFERGQEAPHFVFDVRDPRVHFVRDFVPSVGFDLRIVVLTVVVVPENAPRLVQADEPVDFVLSLPVHSSRRHDSNKSNIFYSIKTHTNIGKTIIREP